MLIKNEKIHINIQDDKGRTPLHHAIMRNHSAIMHILLDYSANANVSYCFSSLYNNYFNIDS